jgi:membrane protein insertase Oxa1/YidC/SpoIIIJ
MITIFYLVPVILIAGGAMYVQYRMLSEERRQHPMWKIMCVLPVLAVGVFLIWIAARR